MTDTTRDMDETEGLASEYVLGTLPAEDRAAAELRIARDPAFAALVEEWQERLSPLNEGYAEVAAPSGVLRRAELRLFPPPPRPARSPLRVWLGALAGLAVAALVLAVLVPPAPRPAPVVATLTGAGQPLVVAATFDPAAGRLTVRRDAGPAAGAGQDYEVWVIPAGQAPVPAGLLGEGELAVALASLPPGTTLAVSLEPAGGSPTGQPTGPVLVSAVIPEA